MIEPGEVIVQVVAKAWSARCGRAEPHVLVSFAESKDGGGEEPCAVGQSLEERIFRA